MSKWRKNPLLGPLSVCLGWALKLSCVETFIGVKRQLLCQFGRLTPILVPVPAFNAGQFWADLERQFGPSNLGQSMDYYILLKNPGCLLSNAIESAPIGFFSSRKSISSAGRSDSNSISSPLSASYQNFAQVPQFQPENTWNHRKTHKLIVNSRNMIFNKN